MILRRISEMFYAGEVYNFSFSCSIWGGNEVPLIFSKILLSIIIILNKRYLKLSQDNSKTWSRVGFPYIVYIFFYRLGSRVVYLLRTMKILLRVFGLSDDVMISKIWAKVLICGVRMEIFWGLFPTCCDKNTICSRKLSLAEISINGV